MSEGPIDFEKKKREQELEKIRDDLEKAHGLKFRVSEMQGEMTIRRGLELAKEIIQSFEGIELDSKRLESQQGYARASSTGDLLKVLALHEHSRNHYEKELIFAFAKTLLSRFPEPKPPTRGRKS